MMVTLDLNAGPLQLVRNFGAKILERIERRKRNVAFLVANMVSEIRIAVLTIRVPDRLRIVYRKTSRVSLVLKTHVVEDKAFGFRSKIDCIGDARGLQIAFSPMPYAAWIEPIAFPGDRIDDVGNQAQSLYLHERVDPVTVRIRHQEHVGFVDRCPPAQTRTVETETFVERLFRELFDRKRQVMPGSDQICETNIDVGRLFIGGKLQHIFGTHKYSY